MFLPRWRLAPDQNAKGFYTNTLNGNRYTFGLNAGGKTGWRGDKLVIDDPNDVVHRYNATKKAADFDTFRSVLSTRVNELARAKFIIVQQRVAYDDYTGRLLSESGWEHLSIPAEFKSSKKFFTCIGWTDPRKEEGERFFDARYPPEALEHMRTISLGEEAYSAQFNQEPFPAGGSRFNKESFVYWEEMGGGLIRLHSRNGVSDLLKLDLCWTFISVDLAASEKTSADYTVFSTWAVTQQFQMLLLNVYRARMTEPKIIEKAIALYNPLGYNGQRHMAFLVEANGLGKPIAQTMAARGLPVIEVTINRTDKIVRSAKAAIRIDGGLVYFPIPSPKYAWMQEWEEELCLFPSAQHDDQVDTLSLACEGVYEVGFIGLMGGSSPKSDDRQAHDVMENKKHVAIGKRFYKR